MKENCKGERFTNGTVELKRFLNVREIKTQQSSERESRKKDNLKRARDTNVTIE